MRLRDEQGMMAIGVALMLIVVLSLFGGALWQYSMAELKRVEKTEQDLQALFLARAGAEMVMGAWLEEPVTQKPEGPIDRIYYDSDSESFTTDGTDECLGYVDVVVTKINDPGGERDQLTEIVATGVVKQTSRTVKTTTFYHLLGHEDPLNWYSRSTGRVLSNDEPADGFVMVRTDNAVSLNFGQRTPPDKTGFTAPVLLFTVPIDLSQNQTFRDRLFGDLGGNASYDLRIRGEEIIFDDVILARLPKDYNAYSLDFGVILELPPSSSGVPGDEIAGGNKDYNYGKVYFDGDHVAIQNLGWTRRGFIIYWYSVSAGGLDHLWTKNVENNVALAGNSFYFRSPTDLSNIQPGDLIPMEESRPRQPFIWE